jgi:hypothetical protein
MDAATYITENWNNLFYATIFSIRVITCMFVMYAFCYFDAFHGSYCSSAEFNYKGNMITIEQSLYSEFLIYKAFSCMIYQFLIEQSLYSR